MTVREIQKPFQIGKQFFIDVVSPTLFAEPPVGVDDHVVERNAVPLVIENQLLRLLFAVSVVLGVPTAEGGEPDELATPRKLHVQPPKLFRILFGKEQIEILRPLLNDVFPLPFRGITALRQENARRIGNRERLGRVARRRQFAAVFQTPADVNFFAVFFQTQSAKGVAFGQIQPVIAEPERVPLPRTSASARSELRAVGNKEGVFIAKSALIAAFDADDIFAQKRDPQIVPNQFAFHVRYLSALRIFPFTVKGRMRAVRQSGTDLSAVRSRAWYTI